mgnify:CR=1 FL=1
MSAIRVMDPAEPPPHGLCWSLWRPGLACPNRATWRGENLDNVGRTEMCTLHKDAFCVDWPDARVRLLRIAEEAS